MSFFEGFADELVKMALPTPESETSVIPDNKGSMKRVWKPAGYYVIKKTASVASTAQDLATIALHQPGKLKDIAKAVSGGPGGSVAKGVLYGTAGYGAVKGLGYRDPKTGQKEPFEGAARGAAKAGGIGALAALVYRYPALRDAVAKQALRVAT